MKKQLLMVALTLGFVATTNCGKKTHQLAPNSSITVKSKKMPQAPVGVTVTKTSGNNRWILSNTGTSPVTIKGKKRK